jgi:inner membrane transporter RhtA
MVIATFVAAPGLATISPAALHDWRWVGPALLVALLSSAIPYPLEMGAMRRLPARTFGILMSLEPAIAALAGWFVLHEPLTPLQWTAVASVIVASAGTAVTARA